MNRIDKTLHSTLCKLGTGMLNKKTSVFIFTEIFRRKKNTQIRGEIFGFLKLFPCDFVILQKEKYWNQNDHLKK